MNSVSRFFLTSIVLFFSLSNVFAMQRPKPQIATFKNQEIGKNYTASLSCGIVKLPEGERACFELDLFETNFVRK